MKDKLQIILSEYGLTSSALAEKMGIQRSGISHIMAGRNKPSYDFLTILLEKFPGINANWLLGNDDNMYHESSKAQFSNSSDQSENKLFQNAPRHSHMNEETISREEDLAVYKSKHGIDSSTGEIESIIILKKDGSFKKYVPES